jgi:hypothetical protein
MRGTLPWMAPELFPGVREREREKHAAAAPATGAAAWSRRAPVPCMNRYVCVCGRCVMARGGCEVCRQKGLGAQQAVAVSLGVDLAQAERRALCRPAPMRRSTTASTKRCVYACGHMRVRVRGHSGTGGGAPAQRARSERLSGCRGAQRRRHSRVVVRRTLVWECVVWRVCLARPCAQVDVFSFGICLWEIWQRGEQPYANLSLADIFAGGL